MEEERGHHHSENPVVSFFVNLFNSIKLALPNPDKNKKKDAAVEKSNDTDFVVTDDSKKGDYVTFPNQKQNLEPLKLELIADEAEKKTNPVLLWQVYAIGGFFVLQWAWKRWNEHRAQKKDDDEPPPNHD